MAKPVTRGELKKELARLATKKDLAELRVATKKDLAELRVATKKDLAELRVETKKDLSELRVETKKDLSELRLETKKDLEEAKMELHGAIAMVLKHMDARFTQQSVELARHVNAILEEMRTMVKAVDEKYADLPGRVSRLEAERG
jgi:SpoVK/Ycf46/Vps4 family AAA+-type ATPase